MFSVISTSAASRGRVTGPPDISVCICTFRRPELLRNLLSAVVRQRTDARFSFDVIVVDNDSERSAESTVREFRELSGVPVTYDVEPVQNISLARNRAIGHATGSLVALIDDDEVPVEVWLLRLYSQLTASGSHGVLGPVVPEFPAGAPRWLTRGGFFDRPRPQSGSRVTQRDARTGNALLRRDLFPPDQPWFDPAYGRTGGEDSDFFERQFNNGAVFVWCDEAIVHERVPPERWKRSYTLKRYLRSGTLDGEAVRAGSVPSRGTIAKNAVILVACAAASVPALLLPQHLSMKIYRKLSYCAGVVTGYLGVSLLRERD